MEALAKVNGNNKTAIYVKYRFGASFRESVVKAMDDGQGFI